MLVFEYQKEKGRRKKLTNPIRSSTQRSTFIPHTQTINFGRIQPRHTLHSNSKKDIIQEEKRHTRRSDFLLIRIPGQFRVAQENGDEHIARSLAESSVNEHFTTTPSFDVGDSDERKEEIADAVAGGEETGHHIGETDGFDEHGGEIVARDVDSGELLNGLRAHSQNESSERCSSSGWVAGGFASEEITDADRVFSFVLDGEFNFAEFGLYVGIHNVGAFDIGENQFGFVDAVFLNEPARRLGKPGDGGVEDGDEDELER